ncbi:uncharacterized protein PAC_14937 [Phialocephala subalpina]|uniref:Uncharacterized protein n=1 Tax=Phialocephala subalpina TaxID=576137 RepID=A0A1L7XJ99_9HELO|nr:uncharacterized protein PAC_14937 [Phialocephala subalpina]
MPVFSGDKERKAKASQTEKSKWRQLFKIDKKIASLKRRGVNIPNNCSLTSSVSPSSKKAEEERVAETAQPLVQVRKSQEVHIKERTEMELELQTNPWSDDGSTKLEGHTVASTGSETQQNIDTQDPTPTTGTRATPSPMAPITHTRGMWELLGTGKNGVCEWALTDPYRNVKIIVKQIS